MSAKDKQLSDLAGEASRSKLTEQVMSQISKDYQALEKGNSVLRDQLYKLRSDSRRQDLELRASLAKTEEMQKTIERLEKEVREKDLAVLGMKVRHKK